MSRSIGRGMIVNVTSLAMLRIAGTAAPLVSLPYLARTLGVEAFGLIAIAQAYAAYFLTVVDYGFPLTATRDVSLHRDSIKELNCIYSRTISARILLAVLATCFSVGLVFLIPSLRSQWLLFLLMTMQVWGVAIFPNWLFLGTEKMLFVAIANLAIQVFFLAGIFLFVRSEEDILYIPASLLFGHLFAVIVGYFFTKKEWGLKFKPASLSSCIHEIRKGFPIFSGTLSTAITFPSILFVLSFLVASNHLGLYAGAQKLIVAGVLLLKVLSDAMYPSVTRLMSQDRVSGSKLFATGALSVAIMGFAGFTVVLFLGRFILVTLFGLDFSAAEMPFKILSVTLIVAPINMLIGTQLLLSISARYSFAISNIVPLVLGIPVMIIFVSKMGILGAAVTTIIMLLAMVAIKVTCLYYLDTSFMKSVMNAFYPRRL